jgi:hypothetical protein
VHQFVYEPPQGGSLRCPRNDFGSTAFGMIKSVGVKFEGLTDFEYLLVRELVISGSLPRATDHAAARFSRPLPQSVEKRGYANRSKIRAFFRSVGIRKNRCRGTSAFPLSAHRSRRIRIAFSCPRAPPASSFSSALLM